MQSLDHRKIQLTTDLRPASYEKGEYRGKMSLVLSNILCWVSFLLVQSVFTFFRPITSVFSVL